MNILQYAMNFFLRRGMYIYELVATMILEPCRQSQDLYIVTSRPILMGYASVTLVGLVNVVSAATSSL